MNNLKNYYYRTDFVILYKQSVTVLQGKYHFLIYKKIKHKNKERVTGVVAIKISCFYYFDCFILYTALKTRCTLLQKWMDDRLRWSETKYPDVSHVYCPSSEIWTPQLFIVNS